MHILSLYLFVIPGLCSFAPPDAKPSGTLQLTERNLTMSSGTALVHAKDPTNSFEVEQSQFELEELYGTENVVQNSAEDGAISWTISLKDGKTVERLRTLDEYRVEAPDPMLPRAPSSRRTLAARDDPFYIAAPADPNNADQVAATRALLDEKVGDKALITEVKLDDKVLIWGSLQLSEAAKAEVEANEGIKGPLRIDGELINLRAVNKNLAPAAPSGVLSRTKRFLVTRAQIFKRAITWKKQSATKDLIMISAFPGSGNLRNFVYDSKAGEDIWIYVIDNGVAPNVENNNPGRNKKELITPDPNLFIQTSRSAAAGQKKDEDDDEPTANEPGSHGTMLAVKAAGVRYGVAKKATIIPVKIMNSESDLIAAFGLVRQHIIDNKRETKSVVVCSKGTPNPTKRDDILNNPDLSPMLTEFDAIMDLGTPIVLAAGNARDEGEPDDQKKRRDIDTWPQLLESATTPLINVGAANRKGGRKEDSQGGNQLTVHAPGEAVLAVNKKSVTESFDGTSVAAPLVAGLIATYLAQGGYPFDGLTGKARVTSIRDYLKSDASSWVRLQDADSVRVIWNGADKPAHDGATTACDANARKRKRQDEEVEEDPVDCPLETAPSPPPPSSTSPPPAPEPTNTPEPPPKPEPKAACKVLEQGLGAGKWEIKGSGWGDDDGEKLKGDLGADDFNYNKDNSDGFEWTVTFVSTKSPGELEGIINSNVGGDFKAACTA